MSGDKIVKLNRFDASVFRVPASDSKGHSVRLSVRVMPVLANAITRMLNSREFPYQDRSELIRHALVRHIKYLESIGEVESVSGPVEAANAALREHKMFEEFKDLFISLRARINDCISQGEQQEARRLVAEMRSHFNRMPEGYWRRQFHKQLSEWDYLDENAPRVRLTQFAQE